MNPSILEQNADSAPLSRPPQLDAKQPELVNRQPEPVVEQPEPETTQPQITTNLNNLHVAQPVENSPQIIEALADSPNSKSDPNGLEPVASNTPPPIDDVPPWEMGSEVEPQPSMLEANEVSHSKTASISDAPMNSASLTSPTEQLTAQPTAEDTQAIRQASRQASAIAITLAGNNEWGELIEGTSLVGMAKELAMNCAAERISDERIDLCLSPKLEHLHSDSRFDEIKSAVMAATNSAISIKLDIDDSDRETPAECLSRLGFEHEEQVRESMVSDPGVKFLMSEFGAKIKENSIKPLS